RAAHGDDAASARRDEVRRKGLVVAVVAPERGEALAAGGCTSGQERFGALAPAPLVGVFGRRVVRISFGGIGDELLVVGRSGGGLVGRRGSRVAAAPEES